MLNKIGIFTFLLALGLTWAGNGTFFYGLIDAAALRRLCIEAGFEVIESGHIRSSPTYCVPETERVPRRFVSFLNARNQLHKLSLALPPIHLL
jgi:hypothetical protein